MTTSAHRRPIEKFAAGLAIAAAVALAPASWAISSAHASEIGHSTRGDSHPGSGTYNDNHAVPSNPGNRGEPVHSLPAQRSHTYDNDNGYHDICAYKPYFYACR